MQFIIGGEVMIKLIMIIFIMNSFYLSITFPDTYIERVNNLSKCQSIASSWNVQLMDHDSAASFASSLNGSWLSSKFCIIIERIMTQQPKNKCILIKALFLCPITCIVFVTNFFERTPVFVFSLAKEFL